MHALGTLARLNEDTQRAILESGACVCIVKGMARHYTSPKCLVEGAAAIGALGSLGMENQRALVEGHAADQLIKAARSHPQSQRREGSRSSAESGERSAPAGPGGLDRRYPVGGREGETAHAAARRATCSGRTTAACCTPESR